MALHMQGGIDSSLREMLLCAQYAGALELDPAAADAGMYGFRPVHNPQFAINS
jgi:hypothetical protein